MQPVNPSLPMPPDLKDVHPYPRTPWNMSASLFNRVRAQPYSEEGSFRTCEVFSTDPEFALTEKLSTLILLLDGMKKICRKKEEKPSITGRSKRTNSPLWYRKSAEQGDASAQFTLGICYANGQGISKNHQEALEWMQRAAERGNNDAKEWIKAYK